MASQFFGLNIAYTGLLASNASLNTVANNIANVETKGYSRQQVTQQAANALQMFQRYGCAGAGVEVIAIERIRDQFYDGRYWDNNANVGEYDQKQYYMKQLETYFDDNGKNAGFKTVFNQFMITGLQELLKNPNDSTAKTQFMGYASALTEYFNGLAGNLQKLQKDLNQEIKIKVDEINTLAGEIANLNKQINTVEVTGTKANELRDRRDLLLDQLSEIVDVEVQEIPVKDPHNLDRDTGVNRYVVRIAGRQTLVDGNEYNGLECVARRTFEKINHSDIDGLYEVYWKDGQKFNLYSGAMGGALKGLVDLRDGNNGENFIGRITDTGKVTDTRKDENGNNVTVTRDTVTIEVGRAYLEDLNKCNLSDSGGIINLGNREYYYDSWSYNVGTDAAGKTVYSYTFTLSNEPDKNPKALTNDRVGKTATVGAGIDYQGIPYYMNQMNEWVKTFAQKFNDIVTQGYDAQGRLGVKMFTGDKAAEDGQYAFPDGSRYDMFLKGKELLQQAYEKAPETLVLEAAAKPIYAAAIADTTKYQADVDAVKAGKLPAKVKAKKEEALLKKIDDAIAAAMADTAANSIKTAIAAKTASLKTADPKLSDAEAGNQARAAIASDLKSGANGSLAKITLMTDEENAAADAADAEAQTEAVAEVQSRYKAEALEKAEQAIKAQGTWDQAIAAATAEVLSGTPEGKAALEQAKAVIARENGLSVAALDMADQLVQGKWQELKDKETDPANIPADRLKATLDQAFRTAQFSVSVRDDSYYQLTALNFTILEALEIDPSRLANRYNKNDGVEQSDLLKDIKDLATNKERMSYRGCTASEFLQCVLSDVALNAQRANTISQNFQNVAVSIDTQRMAISGVDEDEEALSLVKFQNGYNLASKMIQTLTEIYDRLILETGV